MNPILKNAAAAMPRTDYPRPMWMRSEWYCLNGPWEFAFDFSVSGEERGMQTGGDYPLTINVPFCPESQLSGIGEHFEEGMPLWYRRRIEIPKDFNRGRWLLHIGAADQETDVYVNGNHAGHHLGGYEAMSFDITPYLQEDNEIVVRVTDDLRGNVQPYGKQIGRAHV